jgi:hypothetical protein
MSLIERLRLRRVELVFSRQVDSADCGAPVPPTSGEVVRLDLGDASRSIPGVPQRLVATFGRLVNDGNIGVALMMNGELAAHAWMSTPQGALPWHVPTGLDRCYWIHNCHTQAAFRGRGFYRLLLGALLAEAACCEGSTTVLIDTSPSNTPSVRAIRHVGFNEIGFMVTYRLPKTRLRWGRLHLRRDD